MSFAYDTYLHTHVYHIHTRTHIPTWDIDQALWSPRLRETKSRERKGDSRRYGRAGLDRLTIGARVPAQMILHFMMYILLPLGSLLWF